MTHITSSQLPVLDRTNVAVVIPALNEALRHAVAGIGRFVAALAAVGLAVGGVFVAGAFAVFGVAAIVAGVDSIQTRQHRTSRSGTDSVRVMHHGPSAAIFGVGFIAVGAGLMIAGVASMIGKGDDLWDQVAARPGLAMVVLGFFLSCGVKDPCNFSNAMLMYLKGMILCAAGTAMNGMFGAERAALYGVSAMESTIFLWLIYLPISAVLSIITVYLKQDNGGAELWHSSGLFARAPFIAFMLALVIAMLGGLPPFIGYSGRQLLFRSVTFISPFIMVMLFLFTMLMLLTGLRFLVSLMTEGRSSAAGYQYSGEITVSFPLMVLLVLFCAASLFPGALFESSVAPSVEALVNRTAPAAALHGGASK